MNNLNIRVSVVIPCFNHGNFIRDAISSVEKCKEDIYEIIIVNDGSTDLYTLDVMQDLKQRGYWIIDQENQGLGAARNNGIAVANGEYILPLDSDNKIRVEYIYKAIEILDTSPKIGVVYGDASYFGEKSGCWKVGEFDRQRLIFGNYIDACAVFRRSIWKSHKYDEDMPMCGYEDWDLWLSIAGSGWQFSYVPEILFDYRVRSNSMISACKIAENQKKLVEYVSVKHISLMRSEYKNLLRDRSRLLSENNSLKRFMKNTSLQFLYEIYIWFRKTYVNIRA